MEKKKLPKGMKSLGQKGNEEYDANVRAKLKNSGSDKRKQAQRLRRLKEMTAEQLQEKGIGLLESPEKFSLEILYVIQEMLKKDLPDKVKLDLLGKMISAKTAFFGSKVELEANIGTSKQIKELQLRNDSWIRAIEQLVASAKMERWDKWKDKFTKEQRDVMEEHIEKFFGKGIIEKTASDGYTYRKLIKNSQEKGGVKWKDIIDDDIEKVSSKYDFKLDKVYDIVSKEDSEKLNKNKFEELEIVT